MEINERTHKSLGEFLDLNYSVMTIGVLRSKNVMKPLKEGEEGICFSGQGSKSYFYTRLPSAGTIARNQLRLVMILDFRMCHMSRCSMNSNRTRKSRTTRQEMMEEKRHGFGVPTCKGPKARKRGREPAAHAYLFCWMRTEVTKQKFFRLTVLPELLPVVVVDMAAPEQERVHTNTYMYR